MSSLGHDEAITQFCGVTGADEERARGLLEACDWNVELAVNMHVDTDNGRSGEVDGNNKPSTSTRATDLSSFAAGPSHNVRPPIPPTQEVLNPAGYPSEFSRRPANRTSAVNEIYDAFRDFQAEAQWQEMENETRAQDSSANTLANKRRTLQDLFRPPLEVIFHGSFVSAREVGKLQNKWLLVNIQNSREFACQILNRDVWSNQTVKDILKEHFIFWQVRHDSSEGQRYIQFYHVSSYPHVSIVDPRTGEQLRSWPTSIDHNSFCDSVIEFLTEHPSLDGSTTDANTMKKLRVKEEEVAKTLYDQSEEAQLEAAIRASLQETEDSNSSKTNVDDDSYTDAIESDTDQTQSSFQAHTSGSSLTHDKKAAEAQKVTTNGQSSTSLASPVTGLSTTSAFNTDFCRLGSTSNKSKVIKEEDEEEEKSQQKIINNNSKNGEKEEIEDYTKYLGTPGQPLYDVMVRFPDGTRDKFSFPSDSLMKALFLLLTSKGYGMNKYRYATNFPKRHLDELPSDQTFSEANINGQMIFLERKPCTDQ